MSLLLLFRSSGGAAPVKPGQQRIGEGQKTFLHTPTTSTVLTDLDSLLPIYIGDTYEIEYAVEEMRRRQFTMVMHQGEDVILLPRLQQGVRCPFWKSEEENCERPLDLRSACYNTGWVGGYATPLKMRVAFPPANRVVSRFESGAREEYTAKPWTIHTPTLRERDIFVRASSGIRYEVLAVTEIRWRGWVMHQELDLRLITRGTLSFIYNVPIPIL
jgi:hypothetical protein